MLPVETERLILRPFAERDVEAIYALVYADRQLREAWSGSTDTLAECRLRFVTDPVWHADDGFGFLAVVLKSSDQLLGLIGFQWYEPGEDTSYMCFEDPMDANGQDPAWREVELTYALGRVYWRCGYATEAAKALIDLGFQRLGLDRIINAVPVHPEHCSLGLMQRLGFRIVKNLSSKHVTSGWFAGAPGAIGILSRADWEERRMG